MTWKLSFGHYSLSQATQASSQTPDGFLGLHLAGSLNLHIISADVNKNLYFCAGEIIAIAVFTKPTVMVVINHKSRSSVYRAFELN